jgi:hypothetical protein
MTATFLSDSVFDIAAADQLYHWTQRWMDASKMFGSYSSGSLLVPEHPTAIDDTEQGDESIAFQVLASVLGAKISGIPTISSSLVPCEKMRRLVEAERDHALAMKQWEWAKLLGVSVRTIRDCPMWKTLKEVRGIRPRMD